MRVFGADLAALAEPGAADAAGTVVLLGADGRVATLRRVASIAEAAGGIAELSGEDEPYLAAVNLPVVVPEKASKARPFEGLIRRRLGWKMPPGGRASLSPMRGGVGGEALASALAAAGHPCLPYPDRDGRKSGLAEIHAPLVLKALLWEGSPAGATPQHPDRENAIRAYGPLPYRAAAAGTRSTWAERAVALDLVLRGLGFLEGYDLQPAWQALGTAANDRDVEAAGSLLDATLLASTARRYLDEPEACAFVGAREIGYTILPSDGFVRRLVLHERTRPERSGLFPKASLRELLGGHGELRALDLLPVPGRAQRFEAVFERPPLYEFDNLDEMLWWKHCRHLGGFELPVEGLAELAVRLGEDDGVTLRLVRSRHKTLSFRFEPPTSWRARAMPRDGKTYAFRVLRATYTAAD